MVGFPLELEMKPIQSDDADHECESLINNHQKSHYAVPTRALRKSKFFGKNTRITSSGKMLFVMMAVTITFLVIMTRRSLPLSDSSLKKCSFGTTSHLCPCDNRSVESEVPEDHHQGYATSNTQIEGNVEQYLDVYQDVKYDDWGRSYREVRRSMMNWKELVLGNLESNALIYESACGIGMNLFMTLDVAEGLGLSNITIFGNDIEPTSVSLATQIGQSGRLPASGRLGAICLSNSISLDYIPADTFDLVFTGYITPLSNPLELEYDESVEFGPYGLYIGLCADKHNNSAVLLKRKAQQRQDKWFSRWVGQMARIAKPGAPIVIEQVSPP